MEPQKPDPRLRARRVALCVLVWSLVGILGGAAFVTERMKAQYAVLGMAHFAPPTRFFLWLSSALRTLPGIVVSALTVALVTSCILRGAWDSHLKSLMIGLVVAIPLFMAVVALSLYLPFIRIAQPLDP